MQALVNAVTVLDELVAGWREARLLNGVVLRALLSLTKRQPEQASSGFVPWDIAEEMGRVLGRQWAAGDTKDGIAAKVREHWGRLTNETWPKKEEGIRQAFEQRGFAAVPVLDRDEGGGQGIPTRYRLVLHGLPGAEPVEAVYETDEASERAAVEEGGRATSDQPPAGAAQIVGPAQPTQIHYICEDVEDASWLARSFARGFHLTGWRRFALRAVLMSGILIVAVAWIAFALTLVGPRSLSQTAYAAFGGAVFLFAFWNTLGHLLMLNSWRIAMAPWWMQSVDDDRLIEWRSPPRFSDKSIKAVRYTAPCPLCEGKVVARSGGPRYLWGLVGRCEEAPSAHVFTFDHVLREGRRIG